MGITNKLAIPSGIAFREYRHSGPNVTVATRAEVSKLGLWQNAFQSRRKDRRYYEIVADTICPEFIYRYLLIEDENGRISALQHFFLLEQDLLAGAGPRWQALSAKVRRYLPRFLIVRTLMVGCAAGEGHLQSNSAAAQRRHARALAANLVRLAREQHASLAVLKEFPAEYRNALACFEDAGFTRIASMPMTRLSVSAYTSFDDYMAKAMSGKNRRDLLRKLRAAERSGPIEMEVVSDISAIADELYPLYLQVFSRAQMRFEMLTKEFFLEIGRRMPDKAKFFIWRQEGRPIAFSLCLTEGDTLYGEYLGLDYRIALQIHLYFYVMRDMIAWAIAHNYRSIVSSALGYAPKAQMGHVLEPLDLYVRHTSPVINAVLKRILPWLEPVSRDKTLKRFPNYADLWAPPPAERKQSA